MSTASLPTVLPVKPSDAHAPGAPGAGTGLGSLSECSQWLTGADGQRLALSQLVLSGLHCSACAGIIESALRRQPGVLDAQVNAASQRLALQWNPAATDAPALLMAINKAGYGAAADVAAPALALRKAERRKAVWRLFVAWFLMMQVMMLAAPTYLAEPGDMAPDLKLLLQWGSWVLSLPVMVFAAGPFFLAAWHQLRQGGLGMDVPVALGLAVSFIASTGATFDPGGLFGHEVYFDSLTMFVAFLLSGRYLELRARHRVAASLEMALVQLPELAERLNADGSPRQVRVSELAIGDRVRIFAGQGFPVDGEVLEGGTEADEALLTGESRPVPKQVGDSVVAGSVNLLGPVTVRVQRVGADTRFEGIRALMRSAMTRRPPQFRLADRVGTFFLWGVLLLAAGGALVWSFIDPSRVVWVAVSVLIVTCPCALALATPSAWLAATGALARRGLLLQRMELLDSLPDVTHVVFDKTGTLTEDAPELCDVGSLDPVLLRRAAALARQSHHPLSRALARACPAGGDEPLSWTDIIEVAGCGMQARDAQGQVWRLGAQAWVRQEGFAADGAAAQLVFGPQPSSGVQVGASWLVLRFQETLRADALLAVQALQAQGLRLSLLSGDTLARVAEVAARAGISDAVGAATPELKLAHVSALQASGHKVLMVGDGINDAPVLALADASIAMGQGALVAKAQADGFLLSERLMDIVDARALAMRSRRVVRQNLAWALAYNLSCIPLALLGWLPPWAAGLGMAASSLLVVSNSLRLGRGLDKAE